MSIDFCLSAIYKEKQISKAITRQRVSDMFPIVFKHPVADDSNWGFLGYFSLHKYEWHETPPTK
jgi:hypothetical protein